jgi:hypothetical protein
MSELAVIEKNIPAMSPVAIDKVRQLENITLKAPQVNISTQHLFHAGIYARTIMIPKGVMLTGALIKIATTLIIFGDVVAYIGNETVKLHGYNVLPASANRKQAFVALSDVYMTMFFRSDTKNVKSAEDEFTDEADMLFSRHNSARNHVRITED